MNAIRTILAVTLASLGAACNANEPVEQLARIGPALVVEGNNRFSLALYQKLRTGRWQSILFSVQYLDRPGHDVRRRRGTNRAADGTNAAIFPTLSEDPGADSESPAFR